ncbi:nucleoside-diphosphate-sugar epimerase [Bellilinea caldifistulae]|uniref:NAD-dependent dehydratase n=1 Tax=Bellilinea caldifistulae TaxID=360411 RepID=A0A0P6X0W5_9CHLR|nr:SDR family NAD(P)-dependent oxidoreductase [Bellilinea caldifistulae]KPL74492.1 NAD-dependent dehydratase [Bellilinea caldifistulae]GAP11694.1 nucleoside-diphosphate-sugar epimerase [Bellilinea caldifistulae]
MNWADQTVLVTGAGGFIGSHLVETLVGRGATVRAWVRYNSRGDPGLLKLLSGETLSKVEIFSGDLLNPHTALNAVEGCQIIFHLGALISIPYSYAHPDEVIQTNLLGTLNILMACRKSGIEKLIHTSSSEVYGTARYAPINEEHPLQAQSPYAASKIGADKLVESFYRAYGLRVVTVRPFNTYGPRQSARAVIPAIITQALVNKKIHLGNVETSRDFTFITDTVAGFIRAAETSGIEGMVINLGSGREIRIGDLVQLIIQKIDPSVVVAVDPERLRPLKSEVFRLISDNSLAGKVLGWQPTVSLDEGISITIDWIKHHLYLYHIGRYEV